MSTPAPRNDPEYKSFLAERKRHSAARVKRRKKCLLAILKMRSGKAKK